MESIGIRASLDYKVTGTEDIKRYNEEMKLSEEQYKRLQELGKWNEATQEAAHYQELSKAVKDYTLAQSSVRSLIISSTISIFVESLL
jgi:adenylosuccinate synthase